MCRYFYLVSQHLFAFESNNSNFIGFCQLFKSADVIHWHREIFISSALIEITLICL